MIRMSCSSVEDWTVASASASDIVASCSRVHGHVDAVGGAGGRSASGAGDVGNLA